MIATMTVPGLSSSLNVAIAPGVGDQLAHRIQKCGHAAWIQIQRGHVGERSGVVDHLVLIVELRQRDPAFTVTGALFGDEGLEAADHVGLDRLHRTRTVEQERDESEVLVRHELAGLASWFEPLGFCRRQGSAGVLIVTGAFDVGGSDPIATGDVRVQSGGAGQPRTDRILGEPGTLSRCRDGHFVVDDGARQLLVEQLTHLRQYRPEVLQCLFG
ncbi:hypothetical protein [Mycolicibacterium sp. A43C]